MPSTFTDLGQTLETFAETIYVRCPKCHKCAQVKRIPSDEETILAEKTGRHRSSPERSSFSPRKLSCLHCSYISIYDEGTQHTRTALASEHPGDAQQGGPHDWYFRLPLWLQTPCCGDILWAFNEEHLNFLERYVTAKQRGKFHVEGQIRNGTMASRLPTWLKSAKNRDQVLKGITRLKAMLEQI